MHHHHNDTDESLVEYLKFVGILVAIFVLSVLVAIYQGWSLEIFMSSFMGVFFVVFGLFKLISLDMFVLTYASYDIVAKRLKAWGYAFPFVELAIGFSYLFLGNKWWLNVITIIITGVASIGVLRELRRKSAFKCACLGTIIKLPLSKVSFVEDFAMMFMALVMIAI